MRGQLELVRSRVDEVRVFASARERRRFLVHAAAAALVLVVAVALARRHLAFLADPGAVRAFVRGYGVWGPAALVALQALQVVVAPLPGQVLAVVAGYLFGAWWGTVYSLVGVTLGSTVAFWLSRRFGRAYVDRMVHADALARFDALGDGYGRTVLFVFFLFPGLPDDVLCFAGGLTRIPLWQLVVIAAVGRAPAFFLVNVVGDFLGTERYWAAIALVAAVVVVSAVGYLNRERLFDLSGGPDESEASDESGEEE
ncbi:TVP38/TMEM64 family protein [Halogeometricum luteum]|uniref:TVP38/TMEM64 family protein n=1 Tax=Halogeometricum luteum TaxID=2950537 RepID=A0ABU2G6C2_9EURY|nr:TVP38/TMEM64 family protein [Halogeometricum sp. S3BR5-2]MDS0296343.1 TVP38/TMEM64 family protein [Halogeometricum sp. S3BR5-2]